MFMEVKVRDCINRLKYKEIRVVVYLYSRQNSSVSCYPRNVFCICNKRNEL